MKWHHWWLRWLILGARYRDLFETYDVYQPTKKKETPPA